MLFALNSRYEILFPFIYLAGDLGKMIIPVTYTRQE